MGGGGKESVRRIEVSELSGLNLEKINVKKGFSLNGKSSVQSVFLVKSESTKK